MMYYDCSAPLGDSVQATDASIRDPILLMAQWGLVDLEGRVFNVVTHRTFLFFM